MKIMQKCANGFIIMLFLALAFAIPVKAENHDHVWYLSDTEEYNSVSDTQHEKIKIYYCEYCDAQKRESVKENHNLESDDYDEFDYEYKKKSDSQHITTIHYSCTDCDYKTTKDVVEDHKMYFDDEKSDEDYIEIDKSTHAKNSFYNCVYCDYEKKVTESGKHEWEKYTGDSERISKTQHKYTIEYTCKICEAEKTKTVKENHSWKVNDQYDYKKVSAKKHQFKQDSYCKQCDTMKTDTIKEKHKYNAYGICKLCEYEKKGTVSLKPKKAKKINSKTWCKVTVKKNGYLVIKTKKNAVEFGLYNKSKRKYPNVYIYCDSSNKYTKYIPVTKGVYYLKSNDICTISYVFKSDPSKKNYSMRNAVNMRKNKVYTTIIYPNQKKKAWARVFKIVLKKSQKIRFSSNTYVWYIYDKKGRYLTTTVTDYDKNGNEIGEITNEKLPKGTYYIQLTDSWGSTEKKYTTGSYYTVKWK